MNDAAHHAPTLPVPTITTPVNAPSPFHSTPTPTPAPPSRPASRRPNDDLPPLPVRNSSSSPVHPPYQIPPDNYIPYAEEAELISLPPPHELNPPLTPVDRTPLVEERSLHEDPEPNPSYVHARDFAYHEQDRQPENHPAALGGLSSPQSRTSTHISQFELIAPPRSQSARNNGIYREDPRQSIIRTQTPSEPRRPVTPMRPSSRMDVSIQDNIINSSNLISLSAKSGRPWGLETDKKSGMDMITQSLALLQAHRN